LFGYFDADIFNGVTGLNNIFKISEIFF